MLYSNTIRTINDVPVQNKKRNCTDVLCTIIGILFSLFMFVMAFVLGIKGINIIHIHLIDNYYKSNFPTDSDHIPCAYGKNQQFTMLYFPDIYNPTKRVCVSLCPNQSDNQLFCRQNSAVPSCKVSGIYSTNQNFQRLGGFCVPIQNQLKDKLIQKSGLTDKWSLLNCYDIIKMSLLISLVIGILWWICVSICPSAMVVISTILSVVVCFTVFVILTFYQAKGFEGKQILKIIFSFGMLLLGILVVIFVIFNQRKIKIMRFFLKWSTSWAKEKCIFFVWIIIYIAFSMFFILKIFFQYLAFLSMNQLVPYENDIYLKFQPNKLWMILNIFQFIWGFQFLKDSCNLFLIQYFIVNFIISGSGSQYYLQKSQNSFCFTFNRMIKYHFGSVVGGSLFNSLFNLIDFLFQSFRCYPGGRCISFVPCCNYVWNSRIFLCNFVRTDVYTMINLSGVPYCNSCHNCEEVINNQRNKDYVGSQSVEFFYRICSYVTCVGISFLICYFMEIKHIGRINVESLLIIILLSYCMVCYFIDFHANSAQGIHVTLLIERFFDPQNANKNYSNEKKQLNNILDYENDIL